MAFLSRFPDLRVIGRHAGTIWAGQIAVMAFAVTDTLILGRQAPQALAALSVGTALYISIYIGLQGFIQSLLPLWARQHGAGHTRTLGASVRQSAYVTLLCALAGCTVLLQGGPIMRLVRVPAELQPLVLEYLHIQALTLPLALLLRSFNTFSQSIGQPRWVMRLQAGSLVAKIPLSLWLAYGGLGVPAQGLAGCAWATWYSQALMLAAAAWLLRHHPLYRPYRVWQWPERPHAETLRSFAHLGIPGSMAIWAEVTAFTTMSLLAAPMGTVAAASQQIASNMAALLYMWPLSLALAGSARVSYWHGSGQDGKARQALRTTLQIAVASALLAALLTAMMRGTIAGWYATDPAIVRLATTLLPLVALYHLADTMQTAGLFLLRCFHVVRTPAVMYALLLWGPGLGGGYWLAYHGATMTGRETWHGPQAFWLASACALAVVATIFMWLLWRQLVHSEAGRQPGPAA